MLCSFMFMYTLLVYSVQVNVMLCSVNASYDRCFTHFFIILNRSQFDLTFLLMFTTYVSGRLSIYIWLMRGQCLFLYAGIRGLWSDKMKKLNIYDYTYSCCFFFILGQQYLQVFVEMVLRYIFIWIYRDIFGYTWCLNE